MSKSLLRVCLLSASAAVLLATALSASPAGAGAIKSLSYTGEFFYKGTKSGSNSCATGYKAVGWEPSASGKYPLFVYLNGTESAVGSGYDSPPPVAVIKAMAERGFVAISASYDNGVSLFEDKAKCLFEPKEKQPESLFAKACSRTNVDCSLGIAVWGHSQGGSLVLKAGNYSRNVRAAWATGIGLGIDTSYKLPRERVRIVNGATDFPNNLAVLVEDITGLDEPSQCTGSSVGQCLRPNGSGWVFVKKIDNVIGSAHCWFQAQGCGEDKSVATGFVEAGSTAPYSLETNANWVDATTRSGAW